MLKFRTGVGSVLAVMILASVAFSFWVRRARSSALDEYLEATPPPAPDTAFVGDEVIPPVPVPEFDLINHTGERITNEDLKGRIVLLTFAYTSCPDSCPVMFGRYLGIQEEFGAQIGTDIELVFISVDPEVDTPERLAAHVNAMGGRWYFLTEVLPVMQDVWEAFHIFVEKDGALVSHANLTYLIDRQGLVRVEYVGLPPESVFVSDIQRILAR